MSDRELCGTGTALALKVTCNGEAIEASVTIHGEKNESESGKSDKLSGIVVFSKMAAHQVRGVLVSPLMPGIWETYLSPVSLDPANPEVKCASLSSTSGRWWHELMNTGTRLDWGAGIKIGVIDRPFRSRCFFQDAEYLEQPYTQSFLKWIENNSRLGDMAYVTHGSKVGSIIGSPCTGEYFGGVAPGAKLKFTSALNMNGELNGNSLYMAIRFLLDQDVDLINISIGDASHPLPAIRKIVSLAEDMGVLCLFAAGNKGGKVLYPACYNECLSVGAVGWKGWGAPGSSALHDSNNAKTELNTELFFPEFTPFSSEIDFFAPGVGVIVNVNGLGLYDLTGSSFSVAFVTGILAAALSADQSFAGMPRDKNRAIYMRGKLRSMCDRSDFAKDYEGAAIPRLPLARDGPL